MRWPWISLVAPLCGATALAAYDREQVLLSGPRASQLQSSNERPWDEPPHADATGNLIFQALASLVQLGPNSKYMNGD